MNVGRAMTDAMQAQRDRDHDRVTYSDLFTFEDVGTPGFARRKRWLTVEEAKATL